MGKKFGVCFLVTAIICSVFLVGAPTVQAATPIYVNTTTGNDTWPGTTSTSPVKTIAQGIALVDAGGTVNVAAGTYTEIGQLRLSKNLTIVGADKATTIIKPNADTAASGDAGGWWLVDLNVEFNLSGVTLDGNGKKISRGIRHKGTGTIQNVHFTNLQYDPVPGNHGFAIYAFIGNAGGVGAVDVSDCQFDNIGRGGMVYFGAGTTGTYARNTYTGKGLGDWLDYGVEVSTGAVATIADSTFTNCRGTATSDGSKSAGIIVLVDGSTATITGNTITGNDIAIKVGYNSPLSSATAYAHYNTISNNTSGTFHGTAGGSFDATLNWWGNASGPTTPTTNPSGTGDAVSDYVTYAPWLLDYAPPQTTNIATTLSFYGGGIAIGTPGAGTGAGYPLSGQPLGTTNPSSLGLRAVQWWDISFTPSGYTTGTVTIDVAYNHATGEETFHLYYWDGAAWQLVENQINGGHGGSGEVLAHHILGTVPVDMMGGTYFGLFGDPLAMPSMDWWALAILCLSVLGISYLTIRRRRYLQN